MQINLPWLDEFKTAKKSSHVPVVLTKDEEKLLIKYLTGTNRLIANLLYGAGLRLSEALRLRVKDIDFGFRQIVVRDGKGAKDRFTILPDVLIEPLQKQLQRTEKTHERTCVAGSDKFACRSRWKENTNTPESNGLGNTFSVPVNIGRKPSIWRMIAARSFGSMLSYLTNINAC